MSLWTSGSWGRYPIRILLAAATEKPLRLASVAIRSKLARLRLSAGGCGFPNGSWRQAAAGG
jgi:hypothetical protein